MIKFLILTVLIAFFLVRGEWKRQLKSNGRFLWISFYLCFSAFQYSQIILRGAPDYNGGGTLGPDMRISMTIVLLFLMSLLVRPNWGYIKGQKWVLWFVFFIGLSLINPNNSNRIATLGFGLFFISHICLFVYIGSYCTKQDIIRGTFDGLAVLCLFQFPLAISFPLLDISAVTEPFQKGAEELATRRGQRDGAVGVFVHPGILAIFSLISSCFFLSCYLVNYQRRASIFLLVLSTVIVILTYSRTSYIAYVLTLVILYYVFNNAKKPLISFGSFFKVLLPSSLIIVFLVFYSPLSDSFLESNLESMMDGRILFYIMAYEVFSEVPILGTGLNAHRDFILDNIGSFTSLVKHPFFFSNPIHNVHLVVLVEIGIIGFITWLVFLIREVKIAKESLAIGQNQLFSLTYIGVIITMSAYGMSGWAPFSPTILSFIFFFMFFQKHNSKNNSLCL